jgi:hypothetical protein
LNSVPLQLQVTGNRWVGKSSLGDRSDHLFAGETTAIEVVKAPLEEVAGNHIDSDLAAWTEAPR